MRAVVAAVGSRGDVQPMLALARELMRRGHEVVVHAPSDFTAWAHELGLPFHASSMNAQEILTHHADEMGANPIRMLGALRSVVSAAMPQAFEESVEVARGADVILTAGQFAAHSAGELLGIPSIAVMYAPTMLRSSHHPPFVASAQALPRWINAALWRGGDVAFNLMFRGPLNRERVRLGLAPVRDATRHFFEEHPVLMACDPVVAPRPPDWDRYDVTVTGPWFYDDPALLDPAVDAFLGAGAPPVYVGFGSMTSPDADRLTRAILAGVQGRRALLAKGWAGIGGGSLPEGAMVVGGPLPHAKVFPRVAAVVHHGGSGTTAAALRAAAPQVLVPHLMDQYYYAHRLERLGLAPPGIRVRSLTGPRLKAAIDATVALPAEPRREVAERLAPADGLKRAVDALEARIR